MIIILYPQPSFGPLLEYSLRQFSNELPNILGNILPSGEMYIKKDYQLDLPEKFTNNSDDVVISGYPHSSAKFTADQTIENYKKYFPAESKVVLIHYSNEYEVDQSYLFSYHTNPGYLNFVLAGKEKIWNDTYTSVNDMKPYEVREAISLLIDQNEHYINSCQKSEKTWSLVSSSDIQFNFENTIKRLLTRLGLTQNQKDINKFYQRWFDKQQYIIDEFLLINGIIDAIELNQYICWNGISIVGEAIIQSRLRRRGVEINCFNLDIFPTDTKNLKKYFS